jgi:hypothetical protein
MSTRLVILISEDTTVAARNRIATDIKSAKVGYWHWFQFGWLLKDTKNRAPKFWRDLIERAAPGTLNVVIRVGDGSWSARGRKPMFDWVHKNWKADTADPSRETKS